MHKSDTPTIEVLHDLFRMDRLPEDEPLARFSVRWDTLHVTIPASCWCAHYLTSAPELNTAWKAKHAVLQQRQPDDARVYRYLHSIGARAVNFTNTAAQTSFLDTPLRIWSFLDSTSGQFASLVESAASSGVFFNTTQPVWFARTDGLGLKSWSSYLEHQMEFGGSMVGPVWNHWIRDRARSNVMWRYQGEMQGKPLESYALSTHEDQAGDRKHLYCDNDEARLWCPITGKPLEAYYLS